MTMDSQKQIENCAFVKAVLMLLIVLYHSLAYFGGNWLTTAPVFSSDVLSAVFTYFSGTHVCTAGFAFVSAYLFAFLKYEKGKYKSFGPFLKNKLKRLIVPYIFAAAVCAVPADIFIFHTPAKQLLPKYALVVSPAQLWFLVMLFILFAVFWLLSDFLARRDIAGLAVVLVIYCIGVVGRAVAPNIFQIWTVCSYFPVFWLGFKIRQRNWALFIRIPVIVYIAADAALYAAKLFLTGREEIICKLLNVGIIFALFIVGALMVFTLFQKLASAVNWEKSSALAFFSQRSMTVYLFHQQIIYIFVLLFDGAVGPYIHTLINFCGALIISLALATLLRRYKATRFLIGEG